MLNLKKLQHQQKQLYNIYMDSTDEQIKRELDVMYKAMRDPEFHRQREIRKNLENKIKFNSKRIGL